MFNAWITVIIGLLFLSFFKFHSPSTHFVFSNFWKKIRWYNSHCNVLFMWIGQQVCGEATQKTKSETHWIQIAILWSCEIWGILGIPFDNSGLIIITLFCLFVSVWPSGSLLQHVYWHLSLLTINSNLMAAFIVGPVISAVQWQTYLAYTWVAQFSTTPTIM